MGKGAASNGRLTRNAWLVLALDVLRNEGIQGVRVERLARDLGVTKGSFYWHFEDRDDLRQSILNFWSEQYTDVIVENREFLDMAPAEGLWAAVIRVREKGLDKYELAVRAWAEHDANVTAVVKAVYKKRAAFLKGFFERIGFQDTEADARTRLMLCYLSWEPNMFLQGTAAERREMLRFQHAILTKR